MKRYLLYSLLLFLLCMSQTKASGQFSTTGTEFWVAYMENLLLGGNGDPIFGFQLYSKFNTTVEISTPNAGMHITVQLTANNVNEVIIPSDVYYSSGSDAYGNKGIKITSKDPIQVIAMHYRLYFSDASLILPVGELDNHYIAAAFNDMYTGQGHGASEIAVVSTQDHNLISITPAANLNSGRQAGQTYSITLDAGQTYQLQSLSDLSGTIIDANEKIAVFGGAATANVFTYPGQKAGANNHLWDETLPPHLWSTNYIALPFKNQGGSPCHIIALEDSTKIYINCLLAITLFKGWTYNFDITIPSLISSNKQIAFSELLKSETASLNQLGDPSFVNLLPSNFYTKSVGFNSSNSLNDINLPYFSQHLANIIVPASAVSDFFIDGINYPKDSFQIFIPDNNYAYATASLKPGYHIFECLKGFNATLYGVGNYDAYSFTAGYQGAWQDPEITIDKSNACLGNAINLNFDDKDSLYNFLWDFGDNTSSQKMRTTHLYLKTGNYLAHAIGYTKSGCLKTYSQVINIQDCGQNCKDCNFDFCGVTMYPNPGHIINIDPDQKRNISLIQVSDALGRIVYRISGYSINNMGNTINLSDARTAIYFLTVVCNGHKSTGKIFIINEN